MDKKFFPSGLFYDAARIYNVQQLMLGLLINKEFTKT
jgi:hypothetical protein